MSRRACFALGVLLLVLLASSAPAALPGFIKMQDGYFYDSATGQPWVPHGIAYQTWNRPLGVWQTTNQIDYDLDEMVKMGANSIRVDFVWKHIEEKGDNQWQWTNYDYLLQACEKRDIRVFALIGYQWPPDWFPDSYYTMHPPGKDSEGIQHTNRWQSDIINYEHPSARAQYSNFIYNVCYRYRTNRAVVGWIVGNEYGYLGLWSLKYDGYDPYCEGAFRTWCSNRYSTVASLNAAWGVAYTNFNQIVLVDQYSWKGREGAEWADMVQWREDSIAKFTAVGARAARAADTNHLLSYSTVGMQWGEEDHRYHSEDRGKIAAACASNNAALAFFSVNNYPWAMDGSETRNGHWGVSFTKKVAGIPVLYTETGFTSTETLFPGITEARQGLLVRNALWESLEAGAIGTHIFTWQDRPWITDREKGFGILYGDRNIKPAFWTSRDTYSLMDQMKVQDLLRGSADPKPDVAFLWDDATDSQYVRFENEMQHEAGALERLGFEPSFILGLGELTSGAYTNYKAIILPRNMRVSDAVPGYTNSLLNFLMTQVIPKGVHVIAVADVPGMQDRLGRPRAAFSNEVSQLFGVDASSVGGWQPDGTMEDSILWQYYHRVNVQFNTNAPAALRNYACAPTVWKYNGQVKVGDGTLWAKMDPCTNLGYETSSTSLPGWNTWGSNVVRQLGWQYEGSNMVQMTGWAGQWRDVQAIPGQKYTHEAYLRCNSDSGLSNGTFGVIAIEWYDRATNLIGAALESARLTAANNAWQLFQVSAVAPSNVNFGRIIRKLDRGTNAPIGTLYVDADTWVPAVVAKSHGAGKAVLVLHSLDMLPDGSGDGEPDNLPYKWRSDILGTILKDYCGVQPAVQAIGTNAHLCLPEYRTLTNGAILMQLKNYVYDRYQPNGGAPQVFTIQSSLLNGKTLRAFEQGKILEQNSDGTFQITLAPDGQEMIYAYGNGGYTPPADDPTSSDKKMFRGSNDRCGVLPTGPASFPLVGQWTNSSLSYPSTIVVAGDYLYVVDNYFRNWMRCLDAKSGSILWSTMIPSGEAFSPWSIAVAGGSVFCTTKNNWGAPTGAVYALDASTGTIKWKHEGVDINCTPVCVKDGIVYFGGAANRVKAVYADTGLVKWESTNAPGASHYGPITVASNKVIVCHSTMYCFDADTGTMLWYQGSGRSYWSESAVAVYSNRIYVARNDGAEGVGVYSLATGSNLWSYTGFKAGWKFAAPALANNKMYIIGKTLDETNAYLYCFNAAAAGAPLWQYPLDNLSDDSSPTIVSNTVYIGGGKFCAINATTGAELWSYDTGYDGYYYSPFTKNGWAFFCDGSLVYGFSDGTAWPGQQTTGTPVLVQIKDAPAVVHPFGDKAYQVKVQFDSVGLTGLKLHLAFMEAGDNGDGVTNEIYQLLATNVSSGSGEQTFYMWIPDYSTADADYKSTPDGGRYQFIAWLQNGSSNRLVESTPFATQLKWGVRPTNGVPATVTKGQAVSLPVEWEDLYEYLWWQNTPVTRNDSFAPRVAVFRSSKTEARYPGHFTKANAVCDWLQTLGYTAGNPLEIVFDNVVVSNGVLFKDDFEDGDYTGWTRAAGCGNWAVAQSITNSTTGVKASWKMDQSAWTGAVNEVLDSSGYACHGTSYGGAKTTSDAVRTRAGYFDGTDDYVEVTNRPTLQVASNLTLSFWIKGSNLGSKRVNPVDKDYGGEFALTIETNRSLSFYHGYSRTSGQYIGWAALPANSLTNNAWEHVVVTRALSTRTLKSYLNGVLKSTYTYASNVPPAVSASPVRLGLGYTGLGFGGVLDEVKIANSAWTTNDVLREYSYGKNLRSLRAWRIGNSDNIMTYANTYTNAAISMDVRYYKQDNYFNDAELYFRYQNRDNFYKVGIRNFYGFWRLKYTVRAGTNIAQQGWICDFPKTNRPVTNVWYNLKVESYGSTNRVYFNGQLVGTFWATNFASGKIGVGASAQQLGIWEPAKGYFFIDDDEYSFWAPEGQSQLNGHPLNLDWGYLDGYFPTLVLPSVYVMSDLEASNICTWVVRGLRSLIATDGGVAMKNEGGTNDLGRLEHLFGAAAAVTNLNVTRVYLTTNDHYVTLDHVAGTNIATSGSSQVWPALTSGKALGTITNGVLRPALIVNTLTNNPDAPAKAFCFNFGVDNSTYLTGNFKNIAKRAFEWARGEAYRVRIELKYSLNPTNPNLDLVILSTNAWILTGSGASNLVVNIPTDGIMTGTNLYWVMYAYPWDATNAWTSHMGFYSSANDSTVRTTIDGVGLQILGIASYAYGGRDWDLWVAYNTQTQRVKMVYGLKEKGTLSDEDNFNDGDYAGWTVTTNNNIAWGVTNGALRATVTSTGGYAYITRTGLNITNRNLTMEYDVCFSNSAAHGGLTYRGRVLYVSPTACGWADNNPVYATVTNFAYGKWVHVVMNVRDGSPYLNSDLYVDGLPVFVSEPIEVTNWTSTTVGFLSPYSPAGAFVQWDNYRLADEQYSFTVTNDVTGQYVPGSTNPAFWATAPDYDPAWWEYDGSAYGGKYQWYLYLRGAGAHSYWDVALYFSPRLMVEATNFPKTLSIGQTVNVPVDWENLDKVPVKMGLYLQDAKTGCRYVESNFNVTVASGSGAYPITIPAGVPSGSDYAWVVYLYPTNAADVQGQRLGRDDTFRFDRRGYGVEPETVVSVSATGGSYVAYADIGIPMDASAFTWGGTHDGNYTNGAPEGVKYWKTTIPYLYGGWGIFHEKYMLDLSRFNYMKFWVKSRRPIKVEVESPRGTKKAQDLYGSNWNPALAGQWQEVTIPITNFGFGRPLTNVYGSFSVTMLSPRPMSLSFVSTNLGYSCGYMYDGGRYCNVSSIQKSSGNGGTNWTTLLPGSAFEIASFYDIDFVDANTGWIAAYDKKVLKTTDGGTSWVPQTNGLNGSYVRSLDFVDANTGWALDYNSKRIFKTVNGGATWTQQYAGTNPYVYFYKLRFANANNGWAVGGLYGTGKVMRTVNGGATWTEVTCGSNTLYDVYVLDANNVFVSGEGGAVLKSADAGATWTPICIGYSYDTFYGTGWQNTQTGWVCGVNGTVYRTTNGGASWSSFWCGYYGNAADIVFPDNNTMFMALDTPYNTPCILKCTNPNDSYPSWTRMDGGANEFAIDNVRWELTGGSGTGAPPNSAPTVNAGADQGPYTPETLPAWPILSGTATDDGLPFGTLTVTWSQVSGPATVTFTNTATLNTRASLSASGTYVLRLTVSDGALSASDDMTVTINAQGGNAPPVVNAGPDLAITLPSSATLDGTMTDDGLPSGIVTVAWTKQSGAGTVTFGNANAVDTTATFSQSGVYVLRLTASDTALSAYDETTVTVSDSSTNIVPLTVNASPITGTIATAGAENWYSFTVSSAGTFTIETKAGTLLDNYMYLYGPNSSTTLIEEDDDDGDGNAARIVRSLAVGTYYVRMRAYSSASTGTYTIQVVAAQPPVVSSFMINNGSGSTLSQAVTLNNSCTGSPTLYMASESSSFSGASWLTYSTAPSFTLSSGVGAKTVYFKVKNAYFESAAVSDVIQLSQTLPLTVNGSVVTGNIAVAGAEEWYTFTVSTAGTITIDTKAGTLLDNYMYLYGPNSSTTLIEEDDDDGDGNAARIVRSLAVGTYYVRMRAYSSASTGTYTIQVIQ